MKNILLKKAFIVGLVIVLAISGCIAAFLGLYVSQKPLQESMSDEKTVTPPEPGVKVLTKELVFSDPILQDHGEYMNVYVNEADLYSISDGQPVLPVNLSIIELPFGTKILDIVYEYSTPESIVISKKLSFGSCSTLTGENENIYASDDLYPSDIVFYHTGGGLSDGAHTMFLVVRIYPVRYAPSKNLLEYIQHVVVNVTYKEPAEPILENNHIYDLLIVAPSNFIKELQPLVAHKEKHGVKTNLVSVEEVYDQTESGRDKQEQIKYFIKEAIEQWGITYVLLVGGIKGQSQSWSLPIRYSHVLMSEG
jgi:hypothetical protein